MLELLENKDIYNKMANAKNPYGDGHASDRIINDIVYYFSDKSVQGQKILNKIKS